MSVSREARVFGPGRIAAVMLGLVMVVTGAVGGLTPAQAVGTVHAPITGYGSTWSENALQAWVRNVWSNYQWRIDYNGNGSTQGRNAFANGTADFGVSEIPYAIVNSNEADTRPNRKFAYMPIVAGGTAFMYNLTIAGKKVTNLRLSGETIAKIFTDEITVWNDPAIAGDNPSLDLPGIPIVPVVRSDGSGTSAQFTMWMRQQHPAIWDAYCGKVSRPLVNGHCGVTSNYPVSPGSKMVSRARADGVAGYVAQPHAAGAITFVEYSYALASGFPVVKMLNESGYYVEPRAGNVAVGLLSAHINEDESSPEYLTQDLRNVYTSQDPRAYPLSSYSYIILPTALEFGFTANKGRTLADFGAYFLCEGQQSAEVLGYSPLPINLVQRGYQQVLKVPGGDPAVKDPVRDCNNPTFSPDGTNRVANETPFPPDCDRKGGPAQCAEGTGGAQDTPTGGGAGGGHQGGEQAGGGGRQGGGAGTGGAGGSPGAGDNAAGGDGVDGLGLADVDAIGGGAVSGPLVLSGSPQQLPFSQPGVVPALAILGAGSGLLLATVAPPLLGKRARKTLLPTPTRGSPRPTR
ncbi:phosphate ABC transporter substrate-binding protein PstS [Microbacterium album]|uniref:PBP domain-containing protein n=1 Tax=Microbacterium album TaxID=2053191 RepID=A0A917MP16_9MICO|nr:phosphate ABC transporter substrate-binding protein PstS [Microbacterium album]GGH51302.1 hypothetical protein GCM10010921_30640 [Microbacterium album]